MKIACTRFLSACLVALLVSSITGCATKDPMDVSYRSITRNLSPALRGSVERPVDVDRHVQVTSDSNARLFWDDLGRFFYTNHSSALTPMPNPRPSGMTK